MNNNYGFDENDLAAMNRYQLEACLNECHSVGRALNSGAYSVGSSDFRYLDHQFELVLAEIKKRKFNPVFWIANSSKEMIRLLKQVHFRVKDYLLNDLLMRLLRQKTLDDWSEFESEVKQWSWGKISEYAGYATEYGRGSAEPYKITKKELLELYFKDRIVLEEYYFRIISQESSVRKQEDYPYETEVDENGVRHEL